MELKQVIRERRSIKSFSEQAVSPELITELLDTAVWAPNHRMTQPWRFVMVHGAGVETMKQAARDFGERLEKDSSKKKEAGQRMYDKLSGVPMFVLVVMEENPHPMIREEDYAATSCVIQNFSLLAWEQGIGLIWETYGLIHDSEIRQAFGVKPGERIVGSLHIGYPHRVPIAQSRKQAAELITVFDGKRATYE